MAEQPDKFADLLRQLRTRARLTQQELADAAGLSLRTVSDLERSVAATPQKGTVRLLADALALVGPDRVQFETAARGRPLEVVSQAAAATALRSLPRDVASFTGRQRELEQLVASAAAAGGVVGIHAIGGMAGVGKTAFAVHAAHRLAERFPGGQIFLMLHGHTPGQSPVHPADALASLLLAVGVAPAQIPPDLEARAALWRDQAAARPLLLVLDDAASSEQVRPLMPGAGGSLVLVTSRRHLSALDDATAISLDTLPPDEAAALLVRLTGRPGLSVGDRGVGEVIRLCGYLPLAVGMVGRQLRHHPAWSASARAAELASARDRLELIATENLSVAAAFDLSYTTLGPDQQRLFRRLGLHLGSDIDRYAAAALDGTGLSAARRGLEGLYDHYLLIESAEGRYRLHDLLREHARALAGRLDPAEARDAASARQLDYYQHAAAVANVRITGRIRPGPAADIAGPAADGGVPAAVPVLADLEQALTWARAERASLMACIDYAASTGRHSRVAALTAGISGLLLSDGPWADAIVRHTAAIAAAQQLGDRLSRAGALVDVGDVWRLTGDYPAAAQALEEALGIYRDLGDRLGQAHALTCLGALRSLTARDDPASSTEALERALGIYRDLGDRAGQANALHHLGAARWLTSDFPAAAQTLEEALGIYRELGDRLGQANALTRLGNSRWMLGDFPAAAQAQEEALGVFRDLGNRLGQANALNFLGSVLQHTGDFPAAAQALEEALGVFRDLGNRLGQANALSNLGNVVRLTGDFPASVRTLEEALGIYRDLGDRAGQANVFLGLGSVRRLTGDFPAAAQALEEAIAIYRDLGARGSEVEALNERGVLHRASGELAQAQECHQQSLEVSRAINSSADEACALAGLGRCALVAGDAVRAERLLRQALEIFQRSGAAEAQDLIAELDALVAGGSSS
jgi:tetratricopeptide (TPR) repeat protein/transcriptional regulator with XRE-family HTH domain